MAIIGIDLGTTNSLCCVWREGKCVLIPNSLGDFLTPSVVSVDENDEILTGKTAKERVITHPEKTAASFKLYMGTDKIYKLGKKAFRPEELSALILRRLKEDAEAYLNESVVEAIISVPAYFNNNQRSRTKFAGELAGVKVERIINEPSAAALAYHHLTGGNGTYLVVDFGGGTLDISVVEVFENIVDIIAVAGDNHLGGNNIDQVIVDAFYTKYPELKSKLNLTEQASICKMAEQCKINLTTSEQAMMLFVHKEKTYEMYLTNQLLADLCAPLLAKMKAVLKHALKDSGRHIDMIDEIILVGGSGKMPTIQRYMEYLTGKKPRYDIDPDKAIALGVGIVTGIKSREETIRDMIMTDICPFTLGTRVLNRATGDQNEFSPIIERNTSLPVSNEGSYTTVGDNQNYLELDVYQGESPSVLNNVWLGQIHMPIPRAPAGTIQVLLRFTYDINGILEVDATCKQTGESRHKLILTNSNLSEQEVEQRRKELQKLKISPREQDENRYLLERGARLYEERTGFQRDTIQSAINAFAEALAHNHPAEIERARQQFSQFLDAQEDDDFGLLGGRD
jgi:molecular chaperone HscC